MMSQYSQVRIARLDEEDRDISQPREKLGWYPASNSEAGRRGGRSLEGEGTGGTVPLKRKIKGGSQKTTSRGCTLTHRSSANLGQSGLNRHVVFLDSSAAESASASSPRNLVLDHQTPKFPPAYPTILRNTMPSDPLLTSSVSTPVPPRIFTIAKGKKASKGPSTGNCI